MKIALEVAMAVALLSPVAAWSQQQPAGEDWATPPPTTPPPATPPPDQATPPAPPPDPGQPEDAADAPQSPDPTPDDATGQWSYTSQYGWAWLPYAQNYTYVPDDGSIAYEYAYFPTSGWIWIESPWVLGIGPSPYWGNLGYGRFSWYAHPWFTPGSYRGSYSSGARAMSASSTHGASPIQHGSPQLRRTAQATPMPPLESVEVRSAASHSSSHSHGGRR